MDQERWVFKQTTNSNICLLTPQIEYLWQRTARSNAWACDIIRIETRYPISCTIMHYDSLESMIQSIRKHGREGSFVGVIVMCAICDFS